MASGTNGSTVIVNGASWILFITLACFIQSDDRIDIPFFEELVSSIIVAGAVRDKGKHIKVWVEVTELGEGDDGRNAVMALRINDTQIQRQIQFQGTIVR